MSRILVDTSAYSALRRGHREILAQLQEASEIAVNPIVIGELRAGFRRGTHRVRNERELVEFLESPRLAVLSIDEETADRYAVILDTLKSKGTPIPTNDIWISATAMQHGLGLVTTDAHFARVPQVIAHVYPLSSEP